MKELVRDGLREMGILADEAQLCALERYAQLVLEKNRVMNLTAIREPEAFARLHLLDCAALLQAADLRSASLIDVGAGAGFPGLVLRILEPSIHLTLLDSTGKKVDFLREAASSLALENVSCLHARAEEQAHLPQSRECFDFAVSRAVAPLRLLAELALPFVRVGGKMLAMKADGCEAEVSDAGRTVARLGGRLLAPYLYSIPGTQLRRRVVLLEKTGATPPGYPRRWSKMQKEPL